MGPILADTSPLRARCLWLAGALTASIAAVGLSRPAAPPRYARVSLAAIGHCADGVRLTAPTTVPSYYYLRD